MDLINRQDAIDAVHYYIESGYKYDIIQELKDLPSAESEEFEWCHDCKEYDQEAHCCHRYTKAIRQAIDELNAARKGKWAYKTTDAYIQRTCSTCGWSERIYHRNRNQDGLIRNYCPNCGCRMIKS